MISFKWFDPKVIAPKLYKIGLYTMTVKGCQTHIQIQLRNETEKRLQVGLSDLFENFYDFDFKACPGSQWDLEIEEDVLKKIGCKSQISLEYAT